jgi:septum site-determining protein MinC
VVLDLGPDPANQALADPISSYLKDAFQFEAVESPPEKNTPVENGSQMQDDWQRASKRRPADTLVMAGRVRSGQTVTAKNHLIIMGDVNPGSEITAGGDILVLGSLCGTAAAGQPGRADAIIMALDFRPIQIKIGAVVAAGLPESGSKSPEFAHVEDGAIIVEDYLAANPFKRLTWPVVR